MSTPAPAPAPAACDPAAPAQPTGRPGAQPAGWQAGRPNPAAAAPVTRLTVLYDAQCSLCLHLRQWLSRQRQLVPLELIPAASEQAERRFPGLDHAGTLDEITVIGDAGQVYRGTSAWIVCLWALAEHRPKAHWLTTPAGAPFARGTVLAAAKYREATAARTMGAAHCGGRCGPAAGHG
ncbi:DCC1-like thiol-disulfide oxidoreductase family protein [Streptomyces sp. NPDC051907]|uniref:thiol-disulfide oxidoreductase DCC family protein n=1 Tax=Streptomyces sp. NPDC051907 TaxID=3155284 RepID=UPI003424B9D9